MEDPDFCWLISKYKENHPGCQSVETTCLPVVLICPEEGRVVEAAAGEERKIPIGEMDSDLGFQESHRNK
jgi:hypothetical protein